MKTGTNRIGLLYGAIVVTAFLAFVVTYYQKTQPLSAEERTEERALQVGRRLIDSHFEQKTFVPDLKVQERSLASSGSLAVVKKNLSGEVGRDAWGQPFSFQVTGDGIKDSVLYIWSSGANGTAEFRNIKELMAQGPVGDDILISIPF
jgi:hypothetical protein